MDDILSQRRRNRRITWVLMAGFLLLLLLLGFSIDIYTFGGVNTVTYPVATVAALSIAAINSLCALFYGDRLVLKALGARPLEFENPLHRRLHNVAVEMALASGLPMPKVYVLKEAALNAFATGRSPERSAVVVTEGLLEALKRDELEAVVAHEMGHIKNLDILTMTVVAVLVGTAALVSDWAIRSWRYGASRRRSRPAGRGALLLIVMVIFVAVSPFISRIIAMAVSRRREYQADVSAAWFTRNPLALASALEKIARSPVRLRAGGKATAHLFIEDPLERRVNGREGHIADLLSTHPPIGRRIEKLKKMAYVWERMGVPEERVSTEPVLSGA